MKHYDVYISLYVAGYEKGVVNRVQAEYEDDAVYSAFCDEVQYLSDDEVAQALKASHACGLGRHLVDADLSMDVERVVELIEVPINVNGTDAVALVPDPKTYIGQNYFL